MDNYTPLNVGNLEAKKNSIVSKLLLFLAIILTVVLVALVIVLIKK